MPRYKLVHTSSSFDASHDPAQSSFKPAPQLRRPHRAGQNLDLSHLPSRTVPSSALRALSSRSRLLQPLQPSSSTSIKPSTMSSHNDEKPPVFNYVLSFILVGLAWGLTTPFIRRAARTHNPPAHPILDSPAVKASWVKSKVYGAVFAVVDLLRNPRYAVPLLLNLTGSVWFFLLIGQAELSLTVPIVNTLAFLFTVLGDWYVDGKVISRDTGAGMALMLVGIALCVQSKS